MRISIRKNSWDSQIGEATIDAGCVKQVIDYDRDDFAHELINAHRDLFDSTEGWLLHLSHYLDGDDILQLTAMMVDSDGNRSIFIKG